jgi:hypothetical protein
MSLGKRLPVGRVGEAHVIPQAYLFLKQESSAPPRPLWWMAVRSCFSAWGNSNATSERIMRSKKRIATLAQTWLVMRVLTAGIVRSVGCARKSRSTASLES